MNNPDYVDLCKRRGNYAYQGYTPYTLKELKDLFQKLDIEIPPGTVLKNKEDYCKFLNYYNQQHPEKQIALMKFQLDEDYDELKRIIDTTNQQLAQQLDENSRLLEQTTQADLSTKTMKERIQMLDQTIGEQLHTMEQL
jgi:hypothetical protein